MYAYKFCKRMLLIKIRKIIVGRCLCRIDNNVLIRFILMSYVVMWVYLLCSILYDCFRID